MKNQLLLSVLTAGISVAAINISTAKEVAMAHQEVPVGNIVMSLLSESTYQEHNGSVWIRLSGLSIKGTKLERLLKHSPSKHLGDISSRELPAVDGHFPRISESETEVGLLEASSVGPHPHFTNVIDAHTNRGEPTAFGIVNAFHDKRSVGERNITTSPKAENKPKNVRLNYFIKINTCIKASNPNNCY